MYINRPCRFILIVSKAVAYLACNVYRRERAEMGMNLVVPHRTLGSPGTPGPRSTPRQQVIFVNTYKYRGQSANMHKVSK